MSNRFADIENTIQHSRRGRAKRRARKQAQADRPAVGESAAMRALGKRRTIPLAMMLRPTGQQLRVRSFSTPVDYAVPGPFDVIAQPNAMGCWATVFTMMHGWKNQQCLQIEDALATVGQKWVDMFKAVKGLSSSDKNTFLAEAGLVAEPPMSYSVEGWENLLRDYGPLWVTTDENPGPKFSIHARIITSIRGDGTPDGTRLHIIDPAGGREYDETVAVFIPKFEAEVLETGHVRVQVVHWKAGARLSTGQSVARAYSHRYMPRAQRARYPSAFAQDETLDQVKARLVSEGVPKPEIDAFLASVGVQMSFARARPRALAGAPVRITLPPASLLDNWKGQLLITALKTAAPIMAPSIVAAQMISNKYKVTIGIGPAVTGGLSVGGSLGAGVLFAPGNRVGFYGQYGGIVGAIVSISASFQLTVVKGGPEVFGGESYSAGVSVDLGEGPSVGAHAIFGADGSTFQGLTAEIGLSLGLSPFEAFAQYQNTGVVMANALARAIALADIPLDPGIGARSIGVDALEPGDIILSTTTDAGSRVIRMATSSEISHASIYVGDGKVVEALADGVGIKSVGTAIADDSAAVAFRYPNLTPAQKQIICDFAKNAVGKKYDYGVFIDQARFKVAPMVCAALPPGSRAVCESWMGKIDIGTSTNDTFYCSELVIAAFQAGGVQLTSGPMAQTPEDIARLRLNNTLEYVGHLKTP